MSADNWATCPKCQKQGYKEFRDFEQKVKDAYGKVPELEYAQLKEKLKEPWPVGGESLREDYEIGIDEKGVFYAIYKGSCDVCGFHFEYRHEEQALKE